MSASSYVRMSVYVRPQKVIAIGSRPSDHYFRSVCLFVQSFSQPSFIRFRSN